jgi:hypothetical protein
MNNKGIKIYYNDISKSLEFTNNYFIFQIKCRIYIYIVLYP